MAKHRAWFATLLAAGIAGSGVASGGEIHTDRERGRELLSLPREDGVWHFVIFGDRTGGPPEGVEVLRQAVHDANLLDPDLVMTVGDLVQGYNTTDEWLPQMREYRDIMNGLNRPWYPVAGNHDVYWRGGGRPRHGHEENYESHFGPLWYWFAHKDAAFVVLYSDEGDPLDGSKGFGQPRHIQFSPTQLAWLQEALDANRERRHIFVFLHHPRWMARYSENNWPDVHRMLVAHGNVRAVFAGHIHRQVYGGRRDGIEYLALATTGGSKPATDIPYGGWMHHFNVVTVRDGGIAMASVPVGELVDPRALTESHIGQIDRLRRWAMVSRQDPLRIRADGSVSGPVQVVLENPTEMPIEVNLRLESAAPSWRLEPDHRHLRLEPGHVEPVEFLAACPPGQDHVTLPSLVAQVDVFGAGRRISLPEARRPVVVGLAELPAESFAVGDSAVRLDGSADCLRIPSVLASPPQGPVTLEGWFLANRFKARQPLVAKSENSEFYLFANEGVPCWAIHLDDRYMRVAAVEALPTGTWSHIAGVYDGNEVRLYVNGKLAASKPAAGQRQTNGFPLYLGADPDARGDPVDWFDGLIDEVRLSRVARYTEPFVPALRFEPDEDTHILLHLDRVVGPFFPDHSPVGAHARGVGRPKIVGREQGEDLNK